MQHPQQQVTQEGLFPQMLPPKIIEENEKDTLVSKVGVLKFFSDRSSKQRLHLKGSTCEDAPKEEGEPNFFRVIPYKRDRLKVEVVAKAYITKREFSKDKNSGNWDTDIIVQNCVVANNYVLRVLDCSEYCIIYENFFCNLEELFRKQAGADVSLKLEPKALKVVLNKKFLLDNRPTPFFLEVMRYILEFLRFLHSHRFAYGGLHPHNVVIVDEETNIKFRGVKCIEGHDKSMKIEDMEDFIRLVRYCAHGGLRNFKDEVNGQICVEAEDFLSIFKMNDNPFGCPRYECFFRGFLEDPLNLTKHPLFWNSHMCINYIQETYNLLVTTKADIYNLNTCTYGSGYLDLDLEQIDLKVSYSGSVFDILKKIRDDEAHFPRQNPTDWMVKGYHFDKVWSNYRNKYPGLITGVHNVMTAYSLRFGGMFKSHWEKFYPWVDNDSSFTQIKRKT